jgi:hypothetical protein
MVSKFAIGFAIFMNSKALWSIELTNKYNEDKCYQFQHAEIHDTQLMIGNDNNIHLVYLETNTLYILIPDTEIHETSLNYLRIQKRKKTKLIIYLKTRHYDVLADGSNVCIKQNDQQENT